jgi:chromosomal replication initiation ATPase DnaA
VCQEIGISTDSIAINCGSRRLSLVKDFICLLGMENGHSLSCIAELLKRDVTSVSHACSRLRDRFHEKPALVEIKAKMEKRMNLGI